MIGFDSGGRRRATAAAAAIALALAAFGATTCSALAHADLRASEPAEGAVLPASPDRIALFFTEPMRVTSLRLLDEAGQERPLRREGPRTGAVAEARASLPGLLPPGAYRVEYRGLSADGHVVGGAVRFRVGNGGGAR